MARILVIDDSEIIRDLLADFLADIGHDVDSAPDGEQGVEMALTDEYDLCICDMHLPKKSGKQILEAVREQNDKLLFVFTDSMPDQNSEDIKRSTNYAFLRKPFDLHEVRHVLDDVLTEVKTS